VEELTGEVVELTGVALELATAWETLNVEPIEDSKRSLRNGVTVKVYAPENTFPEGTEVVIEAITKKAELEKVKDQL
jgi:hypothetical protein